MEKLAALIPPPRIHLTRFFGCLAPHAKIRSQIVPKKEEPNTENTQVTNASNENAPKKKRRMGWAELLARVFAIDMKSCPKCSGELKIVAAIVEVTAIRKILGHLELPGQTSRHFAREAVPANEFSSKSATNQRGRRSHVRSPQKRSFKVQLLDSGVRRSNTWEFSGIVPADPGIPSLIQTYSQNSGLKTLSTPPYYRSFPRGIKSSWLQ